jgi:N-acetylglucosamine-6-phosphate deacetylase
MTQRDFRMLGPQGLGEYRYAPHGETAERVRDAQESDAPWLVPGFVDMHFHGAFGHDLMASGTAELIELALHLERIGYDAVLLTTVTASFENVWQVVAHIPRLEMYRYGYHLEGPFISTAYPGAQPASFIQDFAAHGPAWQRLFDEIPPAMITLAPEIPGGMEAVQRLVAHGVRVSLGHTNATYAEVRQAVARGARQTTHTFNAMRPLHHREAGTVGAALISPELACELIYDRVHVSPPAAAVLQQAKGRGGVLAVSDSTMASGLAPGTELTMWDLSVRVGTGDVRLPDGTLAGSAITLYDAFCNLAADFGPEFAIRATSYNPRAALGDPIRTLADVRTWVELDADFRITQIHRASPSPFG